LRDQLDKLLKGLGDQKPKDLDDAGRAMGQAQGELGNNDLPNAAIDQKNALEAMRKSAGDLAKKLMSKGQQGQQGDTDPFGRTQGNAKNGMGGDVKVPGVSDLARAREILKELRKRAAERGRPQQELDYIDRLLKQF
jgi:Sec-independent protein translocase protein TatA